uniref:Peptidoglycan hydrolase n=1 Tax=Myoviridae sp. ctv9K3 TaxID=2825203 RepID=A0A8S5PYR6_9CAUD|nr:MAG TPA: peptidoglycan hydrolase [Myoviridae sp. ctv9K3]
MNKQEFLSLIVPLAQAEAKRRKDTGTGFVLPSVCVGQAALETGWGGSSLMTKANAFFGIKATASWGGKVFSSKTQECYDSVTYTTITAAFRAYDTPADSVKDYYDLITGSRRYAAAVNATDARTAITAIKEGGYATSPTYVTNVMAVIDSNNLTQYDNVVTGNAEPQPAESKSAEELAQEIINGTWGNNPERRENITAKYGAAAYEAAQAIVNQKAGATEPAKPSKSTEELAQEIINGAWGSNPERRENITAKYGAAAYEAAQARVNEIMGVAAIKSKTAEELADEIIKGKWGSNPERRENITAKYGAAAYKAAQAIVNKRMG